VRRDDHPPPTITRDIDVPADGSCTVGARRTKTMFELLDDLPDDVIGVRAIGEVDDDDYEDVLVPAIEDRLTRHDKIRLLYVLGEEFTGYDDGAAWEDAKLGLKTFNSYDKMAVVTDATWVRRTVKAFGWLIPGEVEVFHADALPTAREWIVA
jgi:hypothetical protein